MRSFPLLLACTLLAACQSTGDIAYAPTVAVVPGPPASVSSAATQDKRDEKPNRLATVRGLYGNPAQVFDTTRPVADEVNDAVLAALKARGMLAAAAPFRVVLTLRKFYGDTYMARRAFIDVDMAVLNQAGQAIYTDTYKNDIGGFDVFSGISDLVPFTQRMMNIALDTLLDKPALRQTLTGAGSPRMAPAS